MATEQDLLAARLEDSIKLSRKRLCFLGFLDEAQAAFCQERLSRRQDVAYLSWGGHEYAERVVLGFFPDYLEPAPEFFPITPLVLSYRKEDKLTHRDFLGSFMALGVERSVIGDIVVGEGQCVAFLREEMGEYFLRNIQKIGRVGVKPSPSGTARCPAPGSSRSAAAWWPLSGWIASRLSSAAPAGKRPPGSSPPAWCSSTIGKPFPSPSG